jgi:acyl-coenzyme A thioesterase PaaI-like protein
MNWMFRSAKRFKRVLNLWPPMLFTGIKLIYLSDDFREAKVKLSLNRWNKNAVGTQFGGSLFAMTDPFYMLMLMARLGKDYVVWDKYADIDFIKPGKTTVYADFLINDERLTEIIENTAHGEKYLPSFEVMIKDEHGELVAKVNRTLYIRKKTVN